MISVVCPVFNEEDYIEKVLAFFVQAQPSDKELIIIDGGSDDRTRLIVQQWADSHPFIRLLDNPSRFVPFALNMAIKASKGEIIVRLDAHTEYAPDYFVAVLAAFEKTGADIVGGPMRAVGKSPFQKAVAFCTSTVMGVGDSSFHDESKEGFVDSVYLGAWKKSVFETIGFFDEQMLRNQDDEFHYRARSKGKRIFLDPSIRSSYYPRKDARSLFKQYFQYGFFKPLVLKKVRSGIRFRHLVPSGFLAYLVTLPLAYSFVGQFALIPLAVYLLLSVVFACKGSAGIIERMCRVIVFPILHISYGSGFVAGLGKRPS